MNADDAEDFTAGLGQTAAGAYRLIGFGVRQGVPEALGLTVREWVEDRLGGYIRLSIGERRDAVAELTGEGMSQRQVADVLGVSQKTVDRDTESFDSNGDGDQDEPSAGESFDSPAEPAVDAVLDRAEAIADVLETVKTERRPKPTPAPPAHPAAAFLWARLGEVRDLDASDASDDQRTDIVAAIDKWTDELERLKGTP
jgi:transcriptional regulator with XRE-family HTH domain